ncbi:MAG: FMN-binding protein [Luteolibacter sp.]
MRLSSGIVILPCLMAAVAPAAMATVYLSPEQALGTIFTDHKAADFKASTLKLTKEQRKAVTDRTGLGVRDKDYQVWTASDGSQMFVDQVVGKHEFITFAMGVGSDGKVRGVEILEYKETYGGEVRRPDWRKQFKGKKLGEAFKLGGDIMNISGATLSCHSVTEGVNRLLAIRALPK